METSAALTKYSFNEGLKVSPPLSVYVHLPWCIRKCPYCDFNSHERSPSIQSDFDRTEERYLDAIELDCDASAGMVWGRSVQTVFIGGGTPSLFSARAIERLLGILRSRFRLLPQCEITLEANPGTFEANRYEGFARAGVNRLSIGVQSFSDEALKRLGRVHSAGQALEAIALARRCFDSYNIDLMYGLPGQSLQALEAEVDQVLALDPPHLSYYQLTLEPNTFFAKHPPVLPGEDCLADMQNLIEDRTRENGLQHYEVSAYAKPGHRCLHNTNYWQFGDYLGIGAGAHGKLSFHDKILRQQKFRKPEAYMEALLGAVDGLEKSSLPEAGGPSRRVSISPVRATAASSATGIAHAALELERVLQPDDLSFEFFLNALRLKEGVPTEMFSERTGLALSRLQGPLNHALKRGLLSDDPVRFAPTALGFQFLNDLQMIFLV